MNYVLKILRNIQRNQKILFVYVMAMCTSIVANFHVVFGFAKTLPQQTYLWSGHYYLDYFYYLQPIAQGLRGGFIAHQLSATDDPSLYPHFEPYILIGQVARLFHLSTITGYWISVFIFTSAIILFEYVVIQKILSKYSFTEKLAALLLTIFATPFYMLHSISPLNIVIFEFWYAPSNFFNRLEPIPHHLLASVIILILILLSATTIDTITQLKTKILVIRSVIIGFLIVFALSFLPFPVAVFFGSFGVSVFLYFIAACKKRDAEKSIKLSILAFIVCGIVIPLAFFIKNYYSAITFFASTKDFENAYHQYLPLSTILLSIGPLLLFVPFGVRSYFRDFKAIKLLLILFVFISYGLFFTNIDRLFNTHNARFLSPLSYILLGSVGMLGMKSISNLFKSYRKAVFLTIVFIMLILSIPVNMREFQRRINDKNIFSPISYIPSTIIDGLSFLDQMHDKKAVLTTPSQFLGVIVPIYVNKHVYVARHSATPYYVEKATLSDEFYRNVIVEQNAYDFVKKNGIGYVILTSIEGYPTFKPYPFMSEIYKNRDITIWAVKSH